MRFTFALAVLAAAANSVQLAPATDLMASANQLTQVDANILSSEGALLTTGEPAYTALGQTDGEDQGLSDKAKNSFEFYKLANAVSTLNGYCQDDKFWNQRKFKYATKDIIVTFNDFKKVHENEVKFDENVLDQVQSTIADRRDEHELFQLFKNELDTYFKVVDNPALDKNELNKVVSWLSSWVAHPDYIAALLDGKHYDHCMAGHEGNCEGLLNKHKQLFGKKK